MTILISLRLIFSYQWFFTTLFKILLFFREKSKPLRPHNKESCPTFLSSFVGGHGCLNCDGTLVVVNVIELVVGEPLLQQRLHVCCELWEDKDRGTFKWTDSMLSVIVFRQQKVVISSYFFIGLTNLQIAVDLY